MEQNPNEETVDVNASPQQPEAKDTLETTDDMDSQASVKMEGSTEADTSASKEKEAVPVETALETKPAQDTEKAPVDADTKAEATENDTDEEKTSATTEVSDTAAAKTEAGAEGMPSDFNTAENASADTAVSEEAIPAENSPKASLENASSEDETFSYIPDCSDLNIRASCAGACFSRSCRHRHTEWKSFPCRRLSRSKPGRRRRF